MKPPVFSRLCCFTAILPAVVFAGPAIEFDRHTFPCGTVIEGKDETLKADFKVTNTGDELLKIASVRPGCGCTVVKFDSVVAPGKSSKIESTVNIKGYRSGPISKSITVTSNAKNEPVARLTIEAKIEAIIEVAESQITLNGKEPDVPLILFVASKKKDLAVAGISFTGNNSGTPEWQSKLPLSLKFTWTATDSIRPDGFRVFKAAIYAPALSQSVTGEIMFKTNHPDKPEVKLNGSFQK